MKKIIGLLLLGGVVYFLWTKYRKPSALELHLDEQSALQDISRAVDSIQNLVMPHIGTIGQKPGTALIIDPFPNAGVNSADPLTWGFYPTLLGDYKLPA